jgi:hypothetical protein
MTHDPYQVSMEHGNVIVRYANGLIACVMTLVEARFYHCDTLMAAVHRYQRERSNSAVHRCRLMVVLGGVHARTMS